MSPLRLKNEMDHQSTNLSKVQNADSIEIPN